jgi:hypothetical protein
MNKDVNNATTVTVTCSSCSANNELDQQRQINCEKCEEPITGHKYGAKGALSAVLAFTVGFTGYGLVDRNFLETERYPMKIEYAMVNACTNADLSALAAELYQTKQEICLCAVEKTVQALPYSEFTDRRSEFRGLLSSNVDKCR